MSRFFTSWGILASAWLVVLVALGGGLTLAMLQHPPKPLSQTARTAVATEALPLQEDSTEATTEEDTAAGSPPEEEMAAEEAAPAETHDDGSDPAPVATPQSGPETSPAEREAAAEPESPAEQHGETAAPDQPATAASGEEHGAAADNVDPAAEQEEGAAPEHQEAAIPVIPPAPEELAYWERYRQPFNMDDRRPRIAVVLSGLGLSDSATEAAIKNLPAAVTLSFSPYSRDLERWIALARARGHEVMLDLPMEPASFPNEDPGPQGLLTNLTVEDNLDRLDWVLSRGSAYVGLAGAMGSRFTASRSDMEPVLRDIKARGLIFLDRRTTENTVVPEVAKEIGLPSAANNRSVDERQASRVAIDARLAQIERIALTDGFAVAMAQPYPVTIERLSDWATELTARGFVIAPISALTNQQTLP